MGYDVSKQSVGFARESSWGVFTAPTQFVPFTGVTLKGVYVEERDDAVIYGKTTTSVDQVNMREDGAAGGFAGPLPDRGFTDDLLWIAMGARATTTSGVPAGYRKDTYTLADGGPSASVQVIRPRESKVTPGTTVEDIYSVRGCQMNQFGLSCEVDKTLQFSADFLAAQETILPAGGVVAESASALTTGLAGVHSASINSTTTVTVANTGSIKAGMAVVGTGIPVGATVASVTNSTTFVLSAAATATNASARLVIGYAKAAPSFVSAAKPFRAATGMVVLTVDTGGGPVEYCFSSYAFNMDGSLSADKRFCGKEVPQRNAPRKLTLSLRGGLYDLLWRDLMASNTTISFKAVHTSTYDSATSLTLTANGVRVKSPAAPDLSVSQQKLVEDVDLEILTPASGEALQIDVVHSTS